MRQKFKILIAAAALVFGSVVFSGEGHSCDPNKSKDLTKNIKASDVHKERFPVISQLEMERMVELKAAFIVDANSRFTYDDGHIPGAVHFDIINGKFSSKLPENTETWIVAYCGGPRCSAWLKAAESLKELGYKNILHYEAGLKGWKESRNGKLAKPEQKVSRR